MLEQARALWTILEHEEMHQETLGYIWHQVPYARKRKPAGYRTETPTDSQTDVSVFHARIPAGIVTLGTDLRETAFAWDNESPVHTVHVNTFGIDAYKVTNGQFMEFVRAGGYHAPQWWRPEDWAWIESASVAHPAFWESDGDRWLLRGMFERVPRFVKRYGTIAETITAAAELYAREVRERSFPGAEQVYLAE